MDSLHREIADRWPALYRWGNLALAGLVAFLFAVKGNVFYSISEVGVLAVFLLYCCKIRRILPLPEKKILLAFAFFAGGVVLSALLQGGWKNIAATLDYAGGMLNFFIVYIGVRCFGKEETLYKAITAGALVCAGVCILYLSDPANMRGGRFYPWSNPNVAVQQLAMLIPFAAVAFYKLNGHTLWRVANMLSFLVIVASAWLTRSRGGIAAFVVGLLVAGVMYWPIFKSRWTEAKKIAASVAALGIVSVLALGIAMTAFSRGSSDESRIHRMYVSYQMFLDHPVSGVGRHNFNEEYQRRIQLIPEASTHTKADKHTHSHNDFVYFLATTGVLGTGGWLIFSLMIWYSLMKNIIRNRYVGIAWAMLAVMVAFYVHGLVDVCMLQYNLSKMFFGILGLAFAVMDVKRGL